jgi:hypothetical protein
VRLPAGFARHDEIYVRTRSVQRYDGEVSGRLTDLPPGRAAAVRTARELRQVVSQGRPKPVIEDKELRDWVREFAESGELGAAINDVVADDPDLAL